MGESRGTGGELKRGMVKSIMLGVIIGVGLWVVFLFIVFGAGIASDLLTSVCSIPREENIGENEKLLQGLPLPEGAYVIATDTFRYGRRGSTIWYSSWDQEGSYYDATLWYVRMSEGMTPEEGLRWYADNLPQMAPGWEPTMATTQTIPGRYKWPFDRAECPECKARQSAPWPEPEDEWQFLVFRKEDAGLSVERGEHPYEIYWPRARKGPTPTGFAPTGEADGAARGASAEVVVGVGGETALDGAGEGEGYRFDAVRDVVVSAYYRAYRPPGDGLCPRQGG